MQHVGFLMQMVVELDLPLLKPLLQMV